MIIKTCPAPHSSVENMPSITCGRPGCEPGIPTGKWWNTDQDQQSEHHHQHTHVIAPLTNGRRPVRSLPCRSAAAQLLAHATTLPSNAPRRPCSEPSNSPGSIRQPSVTNNTTSRRRGLAGISKSVAAGTNASKRDGQRRSGIRCTATSRSASRRATATHRPAHPALAG